MLFLRKNYALLLFFLIPTMEAQYSMKEMVTRAIEATKSKLSPFAVPNFPLLPQQKDLSDIFSDIALPPSLQLIINQIVQNPLAVFYNLRNFDNLNNLNPEHYANLLYNYDLSNTNLEKFFEFLAYLEKEKDAKNFLDRIGLLIISNKPQYFSKIGFISFIKDHGPSALALNPLNQTMLAVATYSGKIQFWNIETRTLTQEIDLAIPNKSSIVNSIRCMAFHPAQNILAVSIGELIKIIDLNDPKKKFITFNEHALTPKNVTKNKYNTVTGLAFNPSGTILASTSDDTTIKLWDAKTWNSESLITLAGHLGFGLTVSFNSNGNLLASAALDGTVKIWDVKTKKLVKTFTDGSAEPIKFSRKYKISSAVFHPIKPNVLALYAHGKNSVTLYDTDTDTIIKEFLKSDVRDDFYSLNFNHDGSKIAGQEYGSGITIWNLLTSSAKDSIQSFSAARMSPPAIFNPKNSSLWAGYSFVLQNSSFVAEWKQLNIPGNNKTFLELIIKTLIKEKNSSDLD